MWHWFQHAFSTYIIHPLRGDGYQWWSGVGSDLGELTLVVAILGTYKHHACHEKGCWRLGHRHPEHGLPTCHRHYHRTPRALKEKP